MGASYLLLLCTVGWWPQPRRDVQKQSQVQTCHEQTCPVGLPDPREGSEGAAKSMSQFTAGGRTGRMAARVGRSL